MKKNNKFTLLLKSCIGLCCATIAIGLTNTFGWFMDEKYKDAGMEATVHGSYFESGDGSDSSPFEIARPIQLYYLAWLQEMGYFNEVVNGSTSLNQYHFYLSADLNMSGYTLPPIGTKTYPFIGEFTGKDKQGNTHSISNLTVDNSTSKEVMTDLPHDSGYVAPEIVGLFGVIGSLNADGTVNGQGTDASGNYVPAGNHTYDTSVTSVSDFYINGCTIKTQSQNALIGIAAGYVNGEISNIGVVKSNLYVKSGTSALTDITSNISDYSIVGYCTADYKDTITKTTKGSEVEVAGKAEPYSATNPGNAWGGSIDMKTLHGRLSGYLDKATNTNHTYVNAEEWIVDENGEETLNSSTTARYYNHYIYDPYNSNIGSFNFSNSSNTDNQYIYLYGTTNKNESKTVTRRVYTNISGDSFYIIQTGEYRQYYMKTNNSDITSSEDQENASKWQFTDSNSGFLYTINSSNSYPYPLFLTLNTSNYTLSLTDTQTTQWNSITEVSQDAGDGYTAKIIDIYTEANGIKYYLQCHDDQWMAIPENSYYLSDDNGNYLKITGTGTTAFTNTKKSFNASIFSFSTPGTNPAGKISTVYGNTTVYLRNNNGTLQLTTNNYYGATFTNDGTKLSTATYNLLCDNGIWKLNNGTTLIQYKLCDENGNYLNASISGGSATLTSSKNENEATLWSFSNVGDNPSGNIATVLNDTVYYLSSSNSGALSLSTNATTWTNDNGKLYYHYSFLFFSSDHYLYFNGTSWTTTESGGATFSFTSSSSSTNGVKAKNYELQDLYSLNFQDNDYYYKTEVTTNVLTGTPTYFPLTVDGNGAVTGANTGYVVSGGFSPSDGSATADIRVSRYGMNSINRSYTANNGWSNVYTIDNTGIRTIPATDHGFAKYDDSKEKLTDVLKADTSNVYGLHFMQTEISKDHVITVPKTVINQNTYYNYELPCDSIDFNLGTKGYVNFFGGTYYFYGEDSFFTFHQVFRNSEDPTKIEDIKEILYVYKGPLESDDYIYLYSDGTYSGGYTSLPDGYTLAFDAAWIKKRNDLGQNANKNKVFYFEIPANAGEYALGSDPDGDGGYLLYLDLSANKQTVYRTPTKIEQITTQDTYEYPLGVAFVENVGDPVSATNSNTYVLNSSYYNASVPGSNFTRTDDNIAVTPDPGATSGMSVGFIGGYPDPDPSKDPIQLTTNESLPVKPLISVASTTTSIDLLDENQSTGVTTHTVTQFVDTVTTYANGKIDPETGEYVIGSDGQRIYSETIRKVVFDIYVKPKGATEEVHVLTFESDPLTGTAAFNFSYSIDTMNNKITLDLQFDQNTNVHVTKLNDSNTNYSFNINGTDVAYNATTPVDIAITKAVEEFASLISIEITPEETGGEG